MGCCGSRTDLKTNLLSEQDDKVEMAGNNGTYYGVDNNNNKARSSQRQLLRKGTSTRSMRSVLNKAEDIGTISGMIESPAFSHNQKFNEFVENIGNLDLNEANINAMNNATNSTGGNTATMGNNGSRLSVISDTSTVGLGPGENQKEIEIMFGQNISKTDKNTGLEILSEVSNDQMFEFIDNVIATKIEGFTVKQCIGYWKGKRENSTIIQIIVPIEEVKKTLKICKQISQTYAKKYNQDCVLISVDDASSYLVTPAAAAAADDG